MTLDEIQTWADRRSGGCNDSYALLVELSEHVKRLERQVESLKVDRKPYTGENPIVTPTKSGIWGSGSAYWDEGDFKGWVKNLPPHEVQAYGKAHEEYCRKQEAQ